MSRRRTKSCQRRYNNSGSSFKSEMCGRRIPRFSESPYCPACQGKIESLERREQCKRIS